MSKILACFACASLISMTGLISLIGPSPATAQPAFGPPGPSMRGDGPPPAARPFSITRSDPGLDAVVSRGSRLELLAQGFGLNEGPVWVPDSHGGYLLVSGLSGSGRRCG